MATAAVTEQARLYGDMVVTWFSAPEIARNAVPGQFVMAPGGDGLDPFLRRNFTIYRIRLTSEGTELGVAYRASNGARSWLARRPPGEALWISGPWGRGFAIRADSSNLLLVSGASDIGPLAWLADMAVADGKSVTLLHADRKGSPGFPSHLLPAEIEIAPFIDASAERGTIPEPQVLTYLRWSDQTFVYGEADIYESLRQVMIRHGLRKPAQALVQMDLPCGTGVCNGCPVVTTRGIRQACRDGPVFELRSLQGGLTTI